MGRKIGNPFPDSEWARQAYMDASYLSVTMGNEFDYSTGELRVKPRFAEDRTPLAGSPGEVFAKVDYKGDLGIYDEAQKLNMIFLMGYMHAQLARLEVEPVTPGELNG